MAGRPQNPDVVRVAMMGDDPLGKSSFAQEIHVGIQILRKN
jgi:hypothetical protein